MNKFNNIVLEASTTWSTFGSRLKILRVKA